jgi:DMSO reductase anchor subunit
MHPAPSVILFTTFSGLGFGLLFWLGLGYPSPTGWGAFAYFAMAYIMAVGGLLASTFHLGHPERAIKALTQWQTSWLSREGIAAITTLVVMAFFGAGLVFFGTGIAPLGWLGALGALTTVFTTAMIYAQMATVPRWRHWTTPAVFLLLSLGGGALFSGNVIAAIVLLIAAGAVQSYVWISGDTRLGTSGTTLATATGLGGIGQVRAFMPPHTSSNYLLREFAFEVGRKHAQNLRILSLVLGFAVPVVLMLLPFGYITLVIAVLCHVAGVLALRWLFFAQAEHVVGLYYGKH